MGVKLNNNWVVWEKVPRKSVPNKKKTVNSAKTSISNFLRKFLTTTAEMVTLVRLKAELVGSVTTSSNYHKF